MVTSESNHSISNQVRWPPTMSLSLSLIAYRLYHDREPPIRCIFDAISAFHLAIKCSLRVGLLQKRSFSLEFPRHVFNFLFQSKGSAVVKKPGRLYQRNDFIELYFNDEHFQYLTSMVKAALFHSPCTCVVL